MLKLLAQLAVTFLQSIKQFENQVLQKVLQVKPFEVIPYYTWK